MCGKRAGEAWMLARGAGDTPPGGDATGGVVSPMDGVHNATLAATGGAATALA
jgi:hypothetical protein